MSDYIDTRDLFKRQQELQEELENLEYEVECAQEAFDDQINDDLDAPDEEEALALAKADLSNWKEEYQEELEELDYVEREVGDEFMHGETLIPTHMFSDYAYQLADDIGAINSDATWPMNHIDWTAAAKELLMDYGELTFQDEDYYYRMS